VLELGLELKCPLEYSFGGVRILTPRHFYSRPGHDIFICTKFDFDKSNERWKLDDREFEPDMDEKSFLVYLVIKGVGLEMTIQKFSR